MCVYHAQAAFRKEHGRWCGHSSSWGHCRVPSHRTLHSGRSCWMGHPTGTGRRSSCWPGQPPRAGASGRTRGYGPIPSDPGWWMIAILGLLDTLQRGPKLQELVDHLCSCDEPGFRFRDRSNLPASPGLPCTLRILPDALRRRPRMSPTLEPDSIRSMKGTLPPRSWPRSPRPRSLLHSGVPPRLIMDGHRRPIGQAAMASIQRPPLVRPRCISGRSWMARRVTLRGTFPRESDSLICVQRSRRRAAASRRDRFPTCRPARLPAGATDGGVR